MPFGQGSCVVSIPPCPHREYMYQYSLHSITTINRVLLSLVVWSPILSYTLVNRNDLWIGGNCYN